MALGFYGMAFIGGFVEALGTFAGLQSVRTVGIVVSLINPTDAMWRLAAHYLQPAILRSSGVLGLGASTPSPLMVWWAAGFTLLVLLGGVRAFGRRAL